MGFGTLFATVAFFVIMAAGAFLFTTNIMYTAEVVSSSLEASSDLQYARLKTDMDIETASVHSACYINVSISNTGSTKILLDSDFKYMDVFVRYEKKGSGTIIEMERIPYTTNNPPSTGYWTNTGISYDAINPGIFDPDERLNILIHVFFQINPGQDDNYVKVVTPNGVWATKTGF